MQRIHDGLKFAIDECINQNVKYSYYVENNKIKLHIHINGKSRMIIMAKTPSENRACYNVRSIVRKEIAKLKGENQ